MSAILTITQGSLTLACMGTSAAETVEGPTLDGTPLAEVVQLARSPRATVLDRGNRVRVLEGTVKRQPSASAIFALAAALSDELALEANYGQPIVLAYGPNPGGMVLTVNDGALTVKSSHVGRMRIQQYRLQCAQLALAVYEPTFASITGVTLPGATVRIVPSGTGSWLQLLDSVSNAWTTIWWVNGAFSTGAATPANTVGQRVTEGFLQLADRASAGYSRDLWWNNGALQSGPLDNTAVDGNPATAARIYSSSAGVFLQLADQASPGQFRTLTLANGAAVAGPLVS